MAATSTAARIIAWVEVILYAEVEEFAAKPKDGEDCEDDVEAFVEHRVGNAIINEPPEGRDDAGKDHQADHNANHSGIGHFREELII